MPEFTVDFPKDLLERLDDFTKGYLVCALWASPGEGEDETLDKYGIEDIDPATIEEIEKECKDFQEKHSHHLDIICNKIKHMRTQGKMVSGYPPMELCGHDFFLTRNGHGAGFWDRGYGEVGEEISQICRSGYGECSLYVGDDGRLYCE